MPATGGSTCQNDNPNVSNGKCISVEPARPEAGQHPRIETAKNENAIILGGGSTSRNGGST